MSRALLELAWALHDGSIAARKAAVAALDEADRRRVAQLLETEALRHKAGRPFGFDGLTLKHRRAAQVVLGRKDEWRRQSGHRRVPTCQTDEFIREALEEAGLEPIDDNVQGVRLLLRNGRARQPVSSRRMRL